jgi:hypothetical protein
VRSVPNEPVDDDEGLTPLHLAIISNQIGIVKVNIFTYKFPQFYEVGFKLTPSGEFGS